MTPLYQAAMNLALMGWEPIPSGSGTFLYWKKGDSYNFPFYSGAMFFNACSIVEDHWFWQEVELRRKQIMAEHPDLKVEDVVFAKLDEERKKREEHHRIDESKKRAQEENHRALTKIRDNCLTSLSKIGYLTVKNTRIAFYGSLEQIEIDIIWNTWEIGSDEKPIEVSGWRLFCKVVTSSYEIYSISDPKDSGKFIQKLGEYVGERISKYENSLRHVSG